jgi:hypothetical protein
MNAVCCLLSGLALAPATVHAADPVGSTDPAFTIIEPLMVFFALGMGLGGYIALGGENRYVDFFTPGLLAAYVMFNTAGECSNAEAGRQPRGNAPPTPHPAGC